MWRQRAGPPAQPSEQIAVGDGAVDDGPGEGTTLVADGEVDSSAERVGLGWRVEPIRPAHVIVMEPDLEQRDGGDARSDEELRYACLQPVERVVEAPAAIEADRPLRGPTSAVVQSNASGDEGAPDENNETSERSLRQEVSRKISNSPVADPGGRVGADARHGASDPAALDDDVLGDPHHRDRTVYAVLTYCVRHRALVENYLDERERAGAEVGARVEHEFSPDGLRARLVGRLGR